jgi:hypothetical protein
MPASCHCPWCRRLVRTPTAAQRDVTRAHRAARGPSAVQQRPPRFTPAQVAEVTARACQLPAEHEVPLAGAKTRSNPGGTNPGSPSGTSTTFRPPPHHPAGLHRHELGDSGPGDLADGGVGQHRTVGQLHGRYSLVTSIDACDERSGCGVVLDVNFAEADAGTGQLRLESSAVAAPRVLCTSSVHARSASTLQTCTVFPLRWCTLWHCAEWVPKRGVHGCREHGLRSSQD